MGSFLLFSLSCSAPSSAGLSASIPDSVFSSQEFDLFDPDCKIQLAALKEASERIGSAVSQRERESEKTDTMGGGGEKCMREGESSERRTPSNERERRSLFSGTRFAAAACVRYTETVASLFPLSSLAHSAAARSAG